MSTHAKCKHLSDGSSVLLHSQRRSGLVRDKTSLGQGGKQFIPLTI